MSRERYQQLKALYFEASRRNEADRVSYLDGACAEDASLRREVESLLAAGDAQRGFLESPAIDDEGFRALLDESLAWSGEDDDLPVRIGRYRVIRRIGEGGMGRVYEAEQDSPRRRVALKVVRAALSSRRSLQRFEQEVQILGRLRHPGIAQIHEAGVAEVQTPGGVARSVPFFAMEFIDGPSLTDFARARELSTTARLELMCKVCEAVHFGHQRGIIHRDLKPSNILVEAGGRDGDGQPKVIDFGVARTMDHNPELTASQTHAGQVVGTIAYMSPEQIVGDRSAVDTRSDVYSLGVLAFEMLTGSLPFDLNGKMLHEAARVVRDEEPRRLSSLSRVLRGDIETIVAKALEKAPARRYQSASELGADLRRLLRHEPIVARPPTLRYQLGKFARRHKELVAGLVLVAIILVGAIITVSLNLASALRHAHTASIEAQRAEAATNYLRDLLASANPGAAGGGRDVRVVDVLDRAAATLGESLRDQPELELQARWTLGSAYMGLGQYDTAETHFNRALELAQQTGGADSREALLLTSQLAWVYMQTDRDALDLAIPALATTRSRFGPAHEVTQDLLWTVAAIRSGRGEADEALLLCRELRDALDRTPTEERRQSMLAALTGLAGCLQATQRWDEAEVPLRQAWALFAEQRDEQILFNRRHGHLGGVLRLQSWSAEADQWYRRTLEIQQRLLGPEHRETCTTLGEFGDFLRYAGRLDEALEVTRQQLAVGETLPGKRTTGLAMLHGRIGQLLSRMGRDSEATEAFASAISLGRMEHGDAFLIPHAWWRESMIMLGYGLFKPWNSQSMRWHGCRALDDALRAAPTVSFSQEEVQWQTFRFSLERWTGDSPTGGAELPLVSAGDLGRFHECAEPAPGLYRLSVSVERLPGTAIDTSVWVLVSPWEVQQYMAFPYSTRSRDHWDSMMASAPRATRSLPSLCLANWWEAGFGPGNEEEYFGTAAMTTIDLPPGEYLCVLAVDDGARVTIDGETIMESWVDRAWGQPVTIDAPLTLSPGPHRVRIEHFQIVGDARLWFRLVPRSLAGAPTAAGTAAE